MQPSLDDFSDGLELLVVLGPGGDVRWRSPSWSSVAALSGAVQVGASVLEVVCEGDRASFLAFLAQDGRRLRCEVPSTAGRSVWLDWTARTGDAGLVYAVARDVTEDVRREELHSENERRLLMAEKLAHLGHWRASLSAPLPMWSDEVFRIHGRDPAQGPPTLEPPSHRGPASWFFERLHPDDAGDVRRAVEPHLERGERYDMEFRMRAESPSRPWVWIRATGQAVRNVDGEAERMVAR